MPYASSSLVLLLGDNQVWLEKLMKTMMKKQHLVGGQWASQEFSAQNNSTNVLVLGSEWT